MQIEIDFEVYKALTVLRRSEGHTYNDVLREVLKIGPVERNLPPTQDAAKDDPAGRSFGGRFLPNGTQFRATYKHKPYSASVIDGRLIDSQLRQHSSASAAARAITNTNVNGLTFWEVKRPGDTIWRKLVALPKSADQ